MRIKTEKINDINLFISFFLAFSGYYVALIALVNLRVGIDTRFLTVPLRLIIVGTIGAVFLSRPKFKLQKGLVFFLLFALAYIIRIFIEYLDYTSSFHILEIEFFLYFMSFVLLPLLLMSQLRLSANNYRITFFAILVSAFILSLETLYFYSDIIGISGRITVLAKEEYGLDYASPLALSYCSALAIGISISYLITNTVQVYKKILIYLTVALSLIPFFLGASRGSILALAFPFALYFIFAVGVKNRFKILLAIVTLSFIFIVLIEYLGNLLFTRFIDTVAGIEMGREIRIYLWQTGFCQFLENPLFGNSLNNDIIEFYPHNIMLEVLISTGIIGFIPFTLFLILIYKKIILIIRHYSEYFWICVIFLQGFTQNMFTGAIYGAAWFAIGAGMILGLNLSRVCTWRVSSSSLQGTVLLSLAGNSRS